MAKKTSTTKGVNSSQQTEKLNKPKGTFGSDLLEKIGPAKYPDCSEATAEGYTTEDLHRGYKVPE